jgi:predicted  nucleic acid-binding Zn-ribbon protein
MCSPVANYTQAEAAAVLSQCGHVNGAKSCANPRAFAHAVGATHFESEGTKAVWRSPCTRCGGAGVVRPWGDCFRCGGNNSRVFESRIAAVSTMWRDLLAIAAGQVAPSIAADRRRDAARTAKHEAETAAAVSYLSANFPALMITEESGRVWFRPGLSFVVMDIARKAAAGLSDAQRTVLCRESAVYTNVATERDAARAARVERCTAAGVPELVDVTTDDGMAEILRGDLPNDDFNVARDIVNRAGFRDLSPAQARFLRDLSKRIFAYSSKGT